MRTCWFLSLSSSEDQAGSSGLWWQVQSALKRIARKTVSTVTFSYLAHTPHFTSGQRWQVRGDCVWPTSGKGTMAIQNHEGYHSVGSLSNTNDRLTFVWILVLRVWTTLTGSSSVNRQFAGFPEERWRGQSAASKANWLFCPGEVLKIQGARKFAKTSLLQCHDVPGKRHLCWVFPRSGSEKKAFWGARPWRQWWVFHTEGMCVPVSGSDLDVTFPKTRQLLRLTLMPAPAREALRREGSLGALFWRHNPKWSEHSA